MATATAPAISAIPAHMAQNNNGPFYAVRAGHRPGVYTDINEALHAAENYPCSQPKRFESRDKALEFMEESFTCAQEYWTSVVLEGKEETSPHTWVAYTGGACDHKGALTPKGGIGVYFGELHPCNYSGPYEGKNHTNQRVELAAILKALEIIDCRGEDLHWQIRSDSQYAINCCSQWLEAWKKNGFKTAKGHEVENQDLIMDIDKYLQRDRTKIDSRVTFKHIDHHADENKEVVTLARKGIKEPLWKP